jgi:hypothetical protein
MDVCVQFQQPVIHDEVQHPKYNNAAHLLWTDHQERERMRLYLPAVEFREKEKMMMMRTRRG